MDPKEAEILGSLGDRSAQAGGDKPAEAEAARQAHRGTSTFAGTLEQVTLEDVAVHFSADEWSLLEGWQKALHQEVMQENYALLLSLGHSVPSEELPSFIRQLEGPALGSSGGGGSDAEGEEPFLAEETTEVEGPWELDCLSDEDEGRLTPGGGGEGDLQSSLHLCALMKLVKEIPKFLYGQGKASEGCSEPGAAAEVLLRQVKSEAHPENLHHGHLEADLAEVSVSLYSPLGTPTSSTEGDWAESRIRGLHSQDAATNTEVAVEKNLVRGWLKPEKEAALPDRPCQSKMPNNSPQVGPEGASRPLSATDEATSLPSCEGSTKVGAESRSGSPQAPARDSPHDSATEDMELRRAKSRKGFLEGTDLRGPEPDACHRGRPSSSGRPAATPLGCASSTAPSPQEGTAEEKPLRGLLKSLRELIVHQPHHTHQATRKPSTSDGQQVPRHRSRDAGSGSPPRPVKTEAADEKPPFHCQRNSRRDRSHCSAQQAGSSPPTFWLAGDRRGCTPEAQASSLFVAVKLEGVTDGSPLPCLERTANSLSPPGGAGAKERTVRDTGSLQVTVKTELTAEEEPPLQGGKEPSEDHHLQPPLPNSSSPHCGTEAGMKLGLWAPYSEAEWRPVTSPLHGLLNCLKEIPNPRPHPSNTLAGKRGGGGRERRKGGRRGRPETLLENLLPPGPEAGLGEIPVRQPQLPVALPSSHASHLRRDAEWQKSEAGAAAEGQKADSLGLGTPLQGLERCLKEIPPNSRSQPCSPAISSSLSSSPDQLLRWTPETGKGSRKEEGLRPGSTPLQDLERCLKKLPSHTQSQPPSPAVSSSFSSSPDGLQRWTPEMGKWTRKEDGLSQNNAPLQGLGRCRKEPSPNSQPCSPAFSSSISSSPDGLHRWKLETSKWTKKEEGVSPISTPLPGPASCLKGIPDAPHSQLYGLPVGSSSEEHRTPGAGGWSPKEEGARPSRVSPLQGLENCLKEIPTSGRSLPDSAPAPRSFPSQKLQRAEAASMRPWPGGDQTGSFLQCPMSTCGSTDTDACAGRSPLLRLMSCLKGIPIQRPSYLDTPSVSSSSSSCSEAERDQRSPGSGAWWNGSPDTCQGSEVDVAVESRRMGSPATLLSSDKERFPSTPESEPPLEVDHGVAAASPLRGLENCLKDVAMRRLRGASIPPARANSHSDAAPPGSEADVLGSRSATEGGTAASRPCLRSLASYLAELPVKPSPSSPQDSSEPRDCDDTHRSTPSGEEEGATDSSPLQGLLKCLQEITAGGPGPDSSSASDPRGETKVTLNEEEADPGRTPQEGGVIPTGSPACGRTCAAGASGNGGLCVLRRRPPVPKLSAQRWRESSSPKNGSKRSLMAVRADDPQAVSCHFKSQESGSNHDAEPENPPKKRCPALELPLPSRSCGQGRPPECLAGVGGLGPALSQKLDRLSTDMSALCRDVSRLQTHMDRLEQDARGWVLELAALRMENRGLSEYVRRMESRCRTLENRSRRNNLRLLGLPEGVEGSDAVSFLQKTLPAMLGLPLDALQIESARRVQGGASWEPSGRPRPLVFRLLRFANKAAILQAARRQPLSYAGTQVTILPDCCSSFLPRRRVPFGVRRTRWATHLWVGSQHSACGCAWTREPLPCSGPLASEREGRGPKGTGAEKWGTGTPEGPGQPGAGPSAGSFEQLNPTHK